MIAKSNDPLDNFTQDSVQRVEQIEAPLKKAKNLSETELSIAQAQVKSERDNWRTLEGYFELLPFHTAYKPVKPALLNNIQNTIEKLLSIQQDIVFLAEADEIMRIS